MQTVRKAPLRQWGLFGLSLFFIPPSPRIFLPCAGSLHGVFAFILIIFWQVRFLYIPLSPEKVRQSSLFLPHASFPYTP